MAKARNSVDANHCGRCGKDLEPETTPVTTSGWYDGRHYGWHAGGLNLIEARCEECRNLDLADEERERENPSQTTYQLHYHDGSTTRTKWLDGVPEVLGRDEGLTISRDGIGVGVSRACEKHALCVNSHFDGRDYVVAFETDEYQEALDYAERVLAFGPDAAYEEA